MSGLTECLQQRIEASRDESFRPEFFDLSIPDHREAVEALLRRHPEALVRGRAGIGATR